MPIICSHHCPNCRRLIFSRIRYPLYPSGTTPNQNPIFEQNYDQMMLRRNGIGLGRVHNARLVVYSDEPLQPVRQPVMPLPQQIKIEPPEQQQAIAQPQQRQALIRQPIRQPVMPLPQQIKIEAPEPQQQQAIAQPQEQVQRNQEPLAPIQAQVQQPEQQQQSSGQPQSQQEHQQNGIQNERRPRMRRRAHPFTHMNYGRVSCVICGRTFVTNNCMIFCEQCVRQF